MSPTRFLKGTQKRVSDGVHLGKTNSLEPMHPLQTRLRVAATGPPAHVAEPSIVCSTSSSSSCPGRSRTGMGLRSPSLDAKMSSSSIRWDAAGPVDTCVIVGYVYKWSQGCAPCERQSAFDNFKPRDGTGGNDTTYSRMIGIWTNRVFLHRTSWEGGMISRETGGSCSTAPDRGVACLGFSP